MQFPSSLTVVSYPYLLVVIIFFKADHRIKWSFEKQELF